MFGYFVLVLLFLAMFALCFFFGVLEWLHPKDDAPIPADSAYVRDEFFLGTSFRNKMAEWLEISTPVASENEGSHSGRRVLRKKNGERILVIPDGDWGKQDSCEDLIYCLGSLDLPHSATLHKEVYALGSVRTGNDVRLQSMAGDREIVLGPRNHVSRWIDASGSVRLHGGTAVQSRVTSRKEIVLEPGASAGVLSAPSIITVDIDQIPDKSPSGDRQSNFFPCCGHREQSLDKDDPATIGGHPALRLDSNTRLISGDVFLPTGSCVRKNIIVKGALRSAPDCHFHGSVKAIAIHLGVRNSVLGNVVSAGTLKIGENGRIAGSVAAEKNVWLANGIRVGAIDKPAAVSAGGSITLKRNVIVHGKLCAGQFVLAK